MSKDNSSLFEQQNLDMAGQLLGREVDYLFLTVNEVLALHDQIISRYGGTLGVRSIGLLESALARPMQMMIYESDMGIIEACGALAQGLIRNHPFVDGNKRTSLFSMAAMLHHNGLIFKAPAPEIVFYFYRLAEDSLQLDEFCRWIATNSTPTEQVNSQKSVPGSRPKG